MLREPSYHALRAFEATVRLGSLSAAAAELNVTTGAISRQISALEEFMGRPLLGRSRVGLSVDAGGQAFANSLAEAFGDMRKAVAQAMHRPVKTTVTLNTYPTFAIQWLMPRLGEFSARAPEVDLRIRPSALDNRFDTPDIDVAVSIGEIELQDGTSVPLFPRLFTPVCSPKLLEGRSLVDLDIIAGSRIFYSDRQVDYWERWMSLAGLNSRHLLDHAVRFENSSLTYQAARESQGFAIGQPILLEGDLDTGRLVAPFDLKLTANRDYFLNYRTPPEPWPAMTSLVNWMSEAAQRYRSDLVTTAMLEAREV